jgi:hypothetical protein
MKKESHPVDHQEKKGPLEELHCPGLGNQPVYLIEEKREYGNIENGTQDLVHYPDIVE